MDKSFRALRIHVGDGARRVSLDTLTDADLPPGDVTIRVEHSSMNYKDALILSGKGGAVAGCPHVPGIDLAGVVEASTDSRYPVGTRVVGTGKGLGEAVWGGYTRRTRLPADRLLPLPDGLDTRTAMILGTAGLTAALCLLEFGEAPGDGRPALVTGAGGGIGSLAVALLAARGYRVTAVERRADDRDFLQALGATTVLEPEAFAAMAPAPLGEPRFAVVVDTVGGPVLAQALRTAVYGATIAACGMVAGFDVPMTLHPFFARAIRLVGIDSVTCSDSLRTRAWSVLAEAAPQLPLGAIARDVPLADVPAEVENFLAGRVRGRLVVS